MRGPKKIGAVVIGRNEGERLRACLTSVRAVIDHVVYVDSGSTDGSVELARTLGAEVVALSSDRPFTAARGRNAGFERLSEILPDLTAVQFIDGDCILNPHWLSVAAPMLERHPDIAVLCGRRRERFPDATPYNRLCDMEWDTPCGDAAACGGDALYRAEAFRDIGGFDDGLIAGEEPDLCHRLRQDGWRVARIGCEMTLHDAAMTRFGQWWQRNRRSGHATAEAHARRGHQDPGLRKQVVSNLFWALAVPLWPLLWWKIARRRGNFYARYIVLGKLPHALGQLHYWRTGQRQTALIEYK